MLGREQVADRRIVESPDDQVGRDGCGLAGADVDQGQAGCLRGSGSDGGIFERDGSVRLDAEALTGSEVDVGRRLSRHPVGADDREVHAETDPGERQLDQLPGSVRGHRDRQVALQLPDQLERAGYRAEWSNARHGSGWRDAGRGGTRDQCHAEGTNDGSRAQIVRIGRPRCEHLPGRLKR